MLRAKQKPIPMALRCGSPSVGASDGDTDSRVLGLRNLGNTCYFSAVMQSLLRTDLLLEELRHWHQPHQQQPHDQNNHQHHQNQQQQHESSQAALTEVFLRFAKNGSDEVLRQLLDAFRRHSTRFIGGGQHDSHDCLIHFLNDLRDEERRSIASTSPSDPRKCLTVVDKVFGGHLVTDYTCLSCGDQHRSCEPLLTISLPVVCSKEERPLEDICGDGQLIGKIESTSNPLTHPMKTSPPKFHRIKTSVKRCFRHFTRFEEIQSEYLCQKCQMNGEGSTAGEPKLTSAIKRTLIYNPPAVLVLHMKRFEQVLGRFRKRSDRIRYKELLDLGPYCISSCKRNNPQDQNVWYSLFGVIVHKGSLTRGHYVAYVKDRRTGLQDSKTFLQTTYLDRDAEMTKKEESAKEEGPKRKQETSNPSPGQWFYVNDEYVRRLKNSEEVLKKEAYLLFYERIGKPLLTIDEE